MSDSKLEFVISSKWDGKGTNAAKADLDKLNRATGQAKTGADSLGASHSRLGQIASGTLVPALGAAAIAAGAAGVALTKMAVDASVQFESAFAGVVKTVDGLVDAQGRLNEEGEALRQQFRDMAQEIPVSVNALAGIGELGGQLGVAKEDLLLFTETIAKVAVATNLTEEAAATSFAQIQNVMNGTQKDVERFASSVVALGNNSATTESQIVDFASRIAGAGAVAKLSMAELAGIGAAFSSIGVEAEAGGTAVQDALLKMNEAVATGNKDLAVFATTAGLSIEEFSRLWREDAAGAFTLFVEGLAAQGDNASVTLDKVGLAGARSTRAFLGLANAGPLLRDSLELANDAFAENNALNAEAEQRFKTRESQLQLLSNKFNDVAISAGDKLGPALDVAIERTDKLLDSFDAFVKSDSFDTFVTNFTAGLAFVTGQMADQTQAIIKNNVAAAQSTAELEDEFLRLVNTADDLNKIDPFANTLTQDSTAAIVRRVAEVTNSTEEFEAAIQSLHQQAMEAGKVGDFNVYEVLGSEQEWGAYYDGIKAEAQAAADELQGLWMQSASNMYELSDRELLGTGYAADRGYLLLADDLTAVGETAEETEARLAAVAAEAERYENSYRQALGQSAVYATELIAAQDALTAAQEGQAGGAEEAAARILAAQEAIRESYRQTAFEGLLAQASLDQLPAILEWAEQQGIIQEGEAAVRLQFAQTVAAIESRTEALANGEQVTEDYLESITLLTTGLFENEEQAALLAGVMSSEMVAAFMAAAANGGSLVDVLAAIGLEAGKIPTEVTVAFISDTSNWNPPQEASGTGWGTNPNNNPTQPTAFASGGVVRGGIPGRDSVPALMMPGEYVLRTSVAQRIGYDTLDALNAGRTTMTSEGRVNNIGGDTYNITTTSNAQARLVATLADQKKKERLAKVLGY